jgi:sigma-B regulation protein RsbU (phosphoserine phosphatase)
MLERDIHLCYCGEGSEQKIYEYREKGIILGQLEDARYQNIELNLKSGDRFVLYTDGIIEATNAAGDLFGWSHFKEFITSHATYPLVILQMD